MNTHGKRVTIVGLGRTAVALAALLKREGAIPFVSDLSDDARLAGLTAKLEKLGVDYETGGHGEAAFREADAIIPSPGVPPTLELIEGARARGATVMSEMEYASQFCTAPILAVTGTNGKTTTTELLRHLLAACGQRVVLAGNNALPLSEAVMLNTPDYYVLEVSSYQLELTDTFRPWIAAFLNVSPDHFARHGDLAGYAKVKARIFASQDGTDIACLNADDPVVASFMSGLKARVVPFSISGGDRSGVWLDGTSIRFADEPIIETADIGMPGRHNVENVMAALGMLRAGGFAADALRAGVRTFRGVEHRIEFVLERGGVSFFNDSKATNIDSLAVALDSMTAPVVLIAGGQGKGVDYGVLRDRVSRKVKHLVTMGTDAPILESAFSDVTMTERATDMHDAVRRASAAACAGDAVLLSPACASFDMYSNFEERGRAFKEAVRALPEEVRT